MGMKLGLSPKGRMRVHENKVLKRGSSKEDGKKSYNEQLHSLYSSPSIITVIKSRRMRGAGCITHWEYKKCIQNFGW
jgi:hypothetical protein